MSAPEKTCGDCARFKVPDAGCPNYESFSEYVDGRPLIDANCAACSDFYQARKTRDKREKLPEHKFCGVAEEGPFEAIYDNDLPTFLVWTEDGFSTVESVTSQGHKVVPKELGESPYPPYGHYKYAIPNREDLFWRARNEFDTFIDVDSIWKDYSAACVLLSYQQEKLLTVPYPFLLGDNESGKSNFLGVLGALSYRPLLAVTLPTADIYGYLGVSDSPGVILEDEVQGFDKDFEKVKIYKAGYAQGAVVPRTLMLPHGRKIEYYRCFGLKGFAAEKIPAVKGFNERCVPISMFNGEPKKPWTERDLKDTNRISELRNILLKWRLASRLEWPLPEPELSFKGRMRELWKPVLQVTHGLSVYETLLNFATERAEERLTGKQNTLEGHLVKVVAGLYANKPIPFNEVWSTLKEDLEATSDDKKPHQMETAEFLTITKSRIGYRLREVLGGQSKTIRLKQEGMKDDECPRFKAYEFDGNKLGRVAKSYGFRLVTKSPSFPTSEDVPASETMRKDHEISMPKPMDTPLELGKLGDSVTTLPETKDLAPQATCSECLNFQRASCAHPNPHMVFPTAVYPTSCRGFLKKEQQDNDSS